MKDKIIECLDEGDAPGLMKLLAPLSKEQREKWLTRKISFGLQPLYFAVIYCKLDMVKALVQLGVNVDDHSDRIGSSLMYAASKGYFDIMQVLIEAGANLRQTYKIPKFNFPPETLLERAVVSGTLACVDLLLEAGGGLFIDVQMLSKAINLENKIIIGLSVKGVPVNRNMPHCEKAITTVKELHIALQEGLQINRPMLLRTCNRILQEDPNNKVLLDLRKELMSDTLKNRCLYYLNYDAVALSKNIAKNGFFSLPQDLQEQISVPLDVEIKSFCNVS